MKKNKTEKKNKKLKLYSFLRFVGSPFIRLLFRVKVYGKERFPDDGAVLICANHLSIVDVMIMFCIMPRQIRFMAKAELFSVPLIGFVIKKLGAFPIDRAGKDVASVKKSLSILSDGEVISVYPQGKRIRGVHPRATSTRSGPGMMVCRTKCTVLPVLFETKKWRIKLFRRVHVRIGEPIVHAEWNLGEERDITEYKRISDSIFDAICALAETPYEGREPTLDESENLQSGENI